MSKNPVLVVFSDDVSAAARFPSNRVSWVKVPALRLRALLAFARARINRMFSHGLLLQPPWRRRVIVLAGMTGDVPPMELSIPR